MNKKNFSALAIVFAIIFFAFNFSCVQAQKGQAVGQALKNQAQNQGQNAENNQGIAKIQEKIRERSAQQQKFVITI